MTVELDLKRTVFSRTMSQKDAVSRSFQRKNFFSRDSTENAENDNFPAHRQ